MGVGESQVANGTVTNTVAFGIDCGSVAMARREFLSFTGANLLRWSAVALALFVMGALIVAVSRKRRVTTARP